MDNASFHSSQLQKLRLGGNADNAVPLPHAPRVRVPLISDNHDNEDALSRETFSFLSSQQTSLHVSTRSIAELRKMATLDQYDFRKIRRSPSPKSTAKQDVKPVAAAQQGRQIEK